MNWFVSEGALATADLKAHLLREAGRLMRKPHDSGGQPGGVCMLASEVLQKVTDVPDWTDAETRYLIVRDISTPACMRLPTALRLHKPDQRLFLTDDPTSVRRWIVARLRDKRLEGIIDAYVLDDLLTVFVGDLTIRQFPLDRISSLERTSTGLDEFSLDEDGSFIVWPALDVHLGPAQLLQSVDPSELADAEVERFRGENTAVALQRMRERRGLRQSDIDSLSERQISRLENGRSRLTSDSASKFARAFGLSMVEFFDELGRLLREWDEVERQEPSKTTAASVR